MAYETRLIVPTIEDISPTALVATAVNLPLYEDCFVPVKLTGLKLVKHAVELTSVGDTNEVDLKIGKPFGFVGRSNIKGDGLIITPPTEAIRLEQGKPHEWLAAFETGEPLDDKQKALCIRGIMLYAQIAQYRYVELQKQALKQQSAGV